KPGKIPSQAACVINGRLPASILPHVGAGGGTPSPKKLNELSASRTQPNMEVARTIMGPKQLGRICLNTIKISELPITRDAWTNSRSLRGSTVPRTSLNTDGI